MNKETETVLNYHERTKHRLARYAKGPESLDWDDQPDPFRRFSGCDIVALPTPGAELDVLFADLDKPELIPAKPLNRVNTGLLLELAFGLSAWKEFGPSRWALRCNPSSGNLHPTEAYLINTDNDLFDAGVYHYVSHDHHLEKRCAVTGEITGTGILIGLTSVHWREAWKYGERAYRYCQHDIGHALGALRYAAAILGWSVELLAEWPDDDIAALLGINRTDDFHKHEYESPDIICRINTHADNSSSLNPAALLESSRTGAWFGKADSLRAYHLYKWPIIDEVSKAAAKPYTEEPHWQPILEPAIKSSCRQTATGIIRQRRSAQHFDGKMPPLPLTDFYRMLAAVSPTSQLPFDMWRWAPKIHLFIFVHRVEGLDPGLYALPRHHDDLEKLQAATLADFEWQKVEILDDNIFTAIPLYHLYSGNFRQLAKTLSCHQPIASDSGFSLAMVAEFSEELDAKPWIYRRLFWECGLIGQVLYLEAEAIGIRSTGIGCYFDNSVHEILGIKDHKFQSLYHFTVGKPLEDKRMQTLPAYAHLLREDAINS
ncbi:MAG: SagB/ThcOx family dehydrogenase [Methylobacter sp.]|nr:SagB/ThcOx family dehydrogenase [Methylobacter sp.]